MKDYILKNRGSSAKARRVKNSLISSSFDKSKNQFPSIVINSNILETPPQIIYTLPNNRKKINGMGNNIEREELYENNMLLKKSLNDLEKQLAKSKYMNVKKELELRKKEKIILDFCKENSKEIKDESKLIPAKESALLILFKQKYDKLKNDYEKECNNNKILKANTKLLQIKEFQIQNDILNQEIKKIKNLYENSQKYYNKYKETLNKLQEIRKKFMEQHAIIINYEKRIESLTEDNTKIKEENNNLKNYLEKIIRKKDQLNIKNKLLAIRNKKLLETKKIVETVEFDQNSYKKNNEELKKEITELKSALNIRISDIKSLKDENEKYKEIIGKIDNTAVEPINYNSIKLIEKKNVPGNIDKIELYKSLYEESLIFISCYEKYLKENKIDPKAILNKYGYNGIVNAKNKVLYNFNNRSEENNLIEDKKINNFDNKTVTGISDLNTKAFSDAYVEEINFILSLLIKNLEAKKITAENMKSKIKEIEESLSEKNNISDKEFITPFLNLLIDTMKVKEETDKQYIEKFLNNFLNALQNNRSGFIQGLNNAFDNIIDYSTLENIENLTNSLAFNLQKIKNILTVKLKEIDKENSNYITIQNFNQILTDLNDPLRMELLEYLLYKMKEECDENKSIFDFNYKIIFELIEKEIPEDFEDNDLGNIISDKLSEFKNRMISNNTDLENVCKNDIKKFVINNQNIEVIEKDTFFNIIEKYKVTMDGQVKEAIYNLFIVNEPQCTNNGKVKMMDFVKLNNLFLNNEYDE